MTSQRRRVLDVVTQEGHVTPDRVVSLVAADGGQPLAASTVYRALEALESLGVVAHTHQDHRAPRYHHADHTGQASEMPQAELLIGKADFDDTKGKNDPFGPWRKSGAKVRTVNSDTDVFGDGSVIALHLPGHTPDHLALLVKLGSGPVLLSGDMYHSREAREKRGVPPFNTSRAQTLQSMDKFEKVAKDSSAKVVIQHEPRDIALLPAFPQAAK